MYKNGKQHISTEDEQGWISSWLRDADREEYDVGVGELGKPTTPPRRRSPVQCYEETSPTNTSFSSGSLFDTPHLTEDSWIIDPFCDGIPDIAPTYKQDRVSGDKTVGNTSEVLQKHLDIIYSDLGSFASFDSPTEFADGLEKDVDVPEKALRATAAPPIDPDKPRITWITSCTQCILADLPCSRTTPYCLRCHRKGQSALCLLHRRKFREEIDQSNASSCTRPVLLKLKGENDTVWEGKLKLYDELREGWDFGEDRRNWVIPPIDSPRGGFRTADTRMQKAYLGEGKGRLTYQELYVAVDY